MTPRILVLGAGDIGSAVAHRLFAHGADIVLADQPAPIHPRRGMAFVDAWFDGTATLDGVMAVMVASPSDLPRQLAAMNAVPCTNADLNDVVAELRPQALVDARMRKRSVPEDLRALVSNVIGLGPGFTAGQNCRVAIETAWGASLGAVLCDSPAATLAGEPRQLGGSGRERFVYAARGGVWRTAAHIGQRVVGGEPVGILDGMPVHAPMTGALRGLTHDGVEVAAWHKVVEIDPREPPDVHGLGVRPGSIARGVSRALGLGDDPDAAFFEFEREFKGALACMPMSMRLKLDRCGVKLSLEQWRALPLPLREVLLEAPLQSGKHNGRIASLLRRHGQQLGWANLPTVVVDVENEAAANRISAWALREHWKRSSTE